METKINLGKTTKLTYAQKATRQNHRRKRKKKIEQSFFKGKEKETHKIMEMMDMEIAM